VSPGSATALPGLAIDLPEAREGSFFLPRMPDGSPGRFEHEAGGQPERWALPVFLHLRTLAPSAWTEPTWSAPQPARVADVRCSL
jgi:hypothetical protein